MVILKRSCKDCKERPTQLEKFDELVEAAKTYSVVLIVGVIVIGYCSFLPVVYSAKRFQA